MQRPFDGDETVVCGSLAAETFQQLTLSGVDASGGLFADNASRPVNYDLDHVKLSVCALRDCCNGIRKTYALSYDDEGDDGGDVDDHDEKGIYCEDQLDYGLWFPVGQLTPRTQPSNSKKQTQNGSAAAPYILNIYIAITY